MVRRLCSRMYSAALDLTRLFPLKSSDRISVSRSEGGYIYQFECLVKRLLLSASFSISSISSGERPLYTIAARERTSKGSTISSLMKIVTLLCSGILRGDIGFKTPSSNIASTVLGTISSPFSKVDLILTKKQSQVNQEGDCDGIFLFSEKRGS